MFPVATAVALLAMATGDHSVARPASGEVRRGTLKASLTVSQSADAKADVVLRVVLKNVSNQRQSFLLERPGAEFFVKDARGSVVHASVPCLQIGPCNPGLPELATLERGDQVEFVERWRPLGNCGPTRAYTVKVKLRAYQGRGPDGTRDVGSVVPFTLLADILMRRDGETGRCVLYRSGEMGPPQSGDRTPVSGGIVIAS
jgi:hypothetical protein